MNRLVVFDCDGTLVDSQHHIVACMTDAFLARGHAPRGAAAVRHVVGLSLVEAIQHLLPEVERDECVATAEAYKTAFVARRQQPDHDEPLFPGIADLLASLDQAGYLLAVATGKARRGLDATLAMHGLARRFVSLQTADRAASKPAPDMVLRAMEEAGADRRRTVVIGDTSFDMLMAKNAGVAAVGVAWGYHAPAALRQAGARHVARDAADLGQAVAAILGEAACASA